MDALDHVRIEICREREEKRRREAEEYNRKIKNVSNIIKKRVILKIMSKKR